MAGAGIDDKQTFGGFTVAGVEKVQRAMLVNRISFPVESTLRSYDPVFGGVLISQSRPESLTEKGVSDFRRL